MAKSPTPIPAPPVKIHRGAPGSAPARQRRRRKKVNPFVLFLRGLAPLVGFQSDVVTYDRSERFAGESKYPFKKMLAFAIDGITSFSVKPLRLITTVGVIIFMISLLMLLYTLVSWIAGHAVLGWTSTLASIWLIGGIQLLSLGVIGEYTGKIYNESKARPRFIIDRYLNDRGDDPVVDRR